MLNESLGMSLFKDNDEAYDILVVSNTHGYQIVHLVDKYNKLITI